MYVAYPCHPLNTKKVDDGYREELSGIQSVGLHHTFIDLDELFMGRLKLYPKPAQGDVILYRGWMLTPERYQELVGNLENQGFIPLTSYQDYVKCHHLPNWYEELKVHTAETHFFAADTNIESNLEKLNWKQYFVKDFVKSNTGSLGSVASSPSEVTQILKELEQYRGQIEGGVSIRQVESYQKGTERRYFVVSGKAFSSDSIVPKLVEDIAKQISSPFFSVDIIETTEGDLRLVELGDGQVSDSKEWPLTQFLAVLQAISAAQPQV